MQARSFLRSTIVLVIGLALASPIGAQSAHELFQQALSKERAEGNLQEAIKLYQRVVDVASTDHALAAKALLQLGRCYEQLGNAEARAAYERLIARYPDQTDLVAQAKSRLAALRTPPTTTPAAMTVQPFPDVKGRILAMTQDGTKAIVRDHSKGQNIAVHDFSRKQTRLLTDVGTADLTNFPVWSPDGRRVAYQQNNFFPDKRPTSELRVVTLDGRSSVVHRTDRYGGVQPVGWTPDGTTLIAVVARPDKTWTVGTIPAAGGLFTPLRSLGWALGSARVSPDGRFIAYLEGDTGRRDVHVVSLDGRRAYRITTDLADDFEPIWSPDSRHLAFMSNRLGSVSLWTVEVKDGQPAGQPAKLKDGMQSANVIDWTERGIVYSEVFSTTDLFTVPMDPVEGRPTGSPQPIPYWRTGRNVNPVWSPDGTRLAFVSSAAAEKNRHFVVVMSAAGGQAREFLIPTTSSQSDLRWFGNGRGLGLSGRDTRGATAVFRLLLDTGEWNTIPLSDREAQTRIEWNHDGSAFYFARVTLAGLKDDGGIFERAVNGNAERLVYRLAPDSAVQTLEFSHDRKSLAIRQATYKGITQTIKIVAVDVVTGEARTALVVEPSSVELGIALASWTPSGDLLVRRPTGQSTATAVAPAEFLLVPTNGGTPRTFAIPRIAPIGSGDTSSVERVVKWSPDGRTMLIGTESRGGQMFIIENPLAATRATTTGRR